MEKKLAIITVTTNTLGGIFVSICGIVCKNFYELMSGLFCLVLAWYVYKVYKLDILVEKQSNHIAKQSALLNYINGQLYNQPDKKEEK